jgi:hypothetical protein
LQEAHVAPESAAVVTTVLVAILADAPPIGKLAVSLFCAATFFVPRLVPSIGIAAGPAKVLLSIVNITYLLYKGLMR